MSWRCPEVLKLEMNLRRLEAPSLLVQGTTNNLEFWK